MASIVINGLEIDDVRVDKIFVIRENNKFYVSLAVLEVPAYAHAGQPALTSQEQADADALYSVENFAEPVQAVVLPPEHSGTPFIPFVQINPK